MKNRLVVFCALLALVCVAAFAADVDGRWMSMPMGRGGPQTFTFKADGATLTGTVQGGRGGPVEITNGKVDGDNLSFEVTRGMRGNSMTVKYSGTVSGDTMKLTVETGGGPRDIELMKQ